MSKPVLLAVDDDGSVLEALVQDLRRNYGARYRILRATSGPAALEVCTELQRRQDAVALFLSDQRMPGMTGVELLEQTIPLFPDAKRALLTAYADTEAAIRAINAAKIHYYLTKPWDPPEERLYPVLDDLLESWSEGYRPPFDGLRVIGHRWSAADHQVRDFLARNQIPYIWLNPAQTGEALQLLQQHNLDDTHLPVVLLPNGEALVRPQPTELAQKIGLRVQAEKDFYDLVIVGAGPAGLAAGVYGASEGLRTLVIEPAAPGGQAGSSSRIENYLGFPSGLSGADLARRAYIQASRFGAEFLSQRACGIRTDGQYHFIQLSDGREVSCYTAMIATGVDYRKLNVANADRLTGAGLYYGAAMTEAMSCAQEDVYIIGGANSAGQAAVYFARYAAKVTMLVRAGSLEKSMSKYLIDQIESTPNIVIETNACVTEMDGAERLERIHVRTPAGTTERPASSLFVFIGAEPNTEWLPPAIMRDPLGFVLSGQSLRIEGKLPSQWKLDREPYMLETSIPGIFVAGDVRYDSVKRVASAVGQGSIAVQFVHQYLARL
ncbi:MAG TPA: FAD-dependent oxidoreductase [Acidobacteriaceae bacterium]|jgi:thioredoxin reductase (NADPH)|nr:FAD-dependent oxidoreductase [Acidobacteriaceae bacterium]